MAPSVARRTLGSGPPDAAGPPPFDPTYGYSVADLKLVQPPFAPPDFATFWAPRYARAKALPPRLTIGPPKRMGDHDVYVAHYDGVDGKRLGGWLALPADGQVDAAVVNLHGYGGREAPDAEELARYSRSTAVLFACIRGFALSADPRIPSDSEKHVVLGIESRATYELGHSVADVWCAANAVLSAAPQASRRLLLDGGSFGGGIGMLALAWDPRFTRAYVEAPTFGFQVLRTRLPTLGSAKAVQHYIARSKNPANVLRTLSYFDAASAARFVRVPTMVAAARSDAFVAPPGQFAIHNALTAPKELLVMSAGHAEIPASEARCIDARRRAWLGLAPRRVGG